MDGFFDSQPTTPSLPVPNAPPPTPVLPLAHIPPPHHVHFFAAAPVVMMPASYATLFHPAQHPTMFSQPGLSPQRPAPAPSVGRRLEVAESSVDSAEGVAVEQDRKVYRRSAEVRRWPLMPSLEALVPLLGKEVPRRTTGSTGSGREDDDGSEESMGCDRKEEEDEVEDAGEGPRYPRYSRRVQSKSEPGVLGGTVRYHDDLSGEGEEEGSSSGG
ncbi:hypothetical protein N657DRAFT_639964 [Parathielavia appendiculata]|uniref:Uncharacterized protein n=1 Tax=Parathielavia appendiculata TaxID=2587402 RepID=A0AAN6Z8V8_9PEZI|nr:hypothetical protein N657DRAFT_639964 [Parathielavia appendiculata]